MLFFKRIILFFSLSVGISVAHAEIGYISAVDANWNGYIYTFDSTMAPGGTLSTPLTTLLGLEILRLAVDEQVGYATVVDLSKNFSIYSFDKTTGAAAPFITTDFILGNDLPVGLAISSQGTGYLLNDHETMDSLVLTVYTFNTTQGGSLTPLLTANMEAAGGLAVSQNIGYLAGDTGSAVATSIYTFDAENGGGLSPIVDLSSIDPGGFAGAFAISEGTGYVIAGSDDSPPSVYTFNVAGGSPSILASFPLGVTASLESSSVAISQGTGFTAVFDSSTETQGYIYSFNAEAPGTASLFLSLPSDYMATDVTFAVSSISDTTPTFVGAIPVVLTQCSFAGLLQTHARNESFRSKANHAMTIAAATTSSPLLAGQFIKRAPVVVESKTSTVTPWIEGFGAYAHQKSQHSHPSFQMRIGGVIAAIDYAQQEKWMGFGLAYSYTNMTQGDNSEKAKIDQEFAVFYARFKHKRIYADAALWGGLYQSKNERTVSGSSATALSHPKGWQLTPHLELGMDYDWSWGRLEPFVTLDWVNNWADSFEEKSMNSTNAGQSNHHGSLLRTEAGLRLYEIVRYSKGQLLIQEKASFVNRKTFHLTELTTFFIGTPGSFTAETFTTARNIGLAEVSLTFESKDERYPYLSLLYQGEFSRYYQSHLGALEIGKDF